MSEEFKQQSKAFLLGFIIIIGVSVVSAWNGPASTALSSNTYGPIDVSATPQGKGKTPTSGTLLDIGGILASNALAVWGDANIQGDVTLGKQATSTAATNRRLCVDSTGKIILCGQQNFAYTTPGGYTFTVPSGVNTIVVELYGGGGAGFSDYYTIIGAPYKNTDGAATSFVHSSDSSKTNLIAYGGKTPTSISSGGAGGSYATNGSQVVSAATTNSAGPGGTAASNAATQTFLCKVTMNGPYVNYELWKGSSGTTGGAGGGTGGGAGGAGASVVTTDTSGNTLNSSSCSSGTILTNLNSMATAYYNGMFKMFTNGRYPTANGADGSGPGSGGGGAGGVAGFGAFDIYSSAPSASAYVSASNTYGLCNDDNGSGTYNKPLCAGQKGVAGGGAGGYIKAKLSVTPGDSYSITVGSGGKADYYGMYWIKNYNPNGTPNYEGVYSGKGAPGAVNITYN